MRSRDELAPLRGPHLSVGSIIENGKKKKKNGNKQTKKLFEILERSTLLNNFYSDIEFRFN